MLKKALLLLPCLFTIVLAGWYPEEQITTSRTGKDLRMNNGRKVVVAVNGVRHLVNGGAAYNRYYPSSGWTADYTLSRKSSYPSIALDPNGTDIHVVWQGGRNIYYQKCVPGSSGNGGWAGTPRDISHGDPRTTYFNAPSVACYKGTNDVHHIVVAWFTWIGDPNVIGFCECVNGNWGEPIYFEGPLGHFPWQPSVAVDPQGRQGDVFLSTFEGYSATVHVRRRVNGVWQPWENVGVGGFCFMDVDPGTGCPHIVFEATGIYHTYRDPSLGWMPLEMISSPGAVAYYYPSMCFSNGSAFVVWAETTSTAGGVRYSIGQYGSWTSPSWLTSRYNGDMSFVSAAASATGDVYTVYIDEVGRYTQLFGRLYTPRGERAQATNEGSMGNKVKADLLNLTIAPNPAINLTTVRYSVPVVGSVNLKLYDAIGREITTLAQGTHEPGRYNIDLDTHTLAQGIYYLKYESGNYHEIKKLIIQR